MQEIKLSSTQATQPANPVSSTTVTSSATQTPPQNSLTSKMPTSSGKSSKLKRFLPILIILIIVSLGIVSGLIVSSRSKSALLATGSSNGEDLPPEQKQSFNQTFNNEAEGMIERNDTLDKYAQGTHKLIRPGGESQTAYLTSSVLDLDQYNGKKVKVFGETFGSSQVGWLMDVGKVEVVK